MVHALRPNPKNNIQEGWRILDWFASHPEGINLFTYLLGVEGIPRNWRTCDGFGVNSFIMYNGEKEVYVKFNWKSLAEGPQYMNDEEAQSVGTFIMLSPFIYAPFFHCTSFCCMPRVCICVDCSPSSVETKKLVHNLRR